jgi:hypothetical protein
MVVVSTPVSHETVPKSNNALPERLGEASLRGLPNPARKHQNSLHLAALRSKKSRQWNTMQEQSSRPTHRKTNDTLMVGFLHGVKALLEIISKQPTNWQPLLQQINDMLARLQPPKWWRKIFR